MAAIAWSDVLGLPGAVTELAGVPALGQVAILGAVNSMLDVSRFDGESGPLTKLARCFLAAHFGALGMLGSGGPLIGEAAAGLSRQYAMPNTRSEYMTTSYGQAYFSLIGTQAFGPRLL